MLNDPSPREGASSAPALSEPLIKDPVNPTPLSSQQVTMEVPVLQDPPVRPQAENTSEAHQAASQMSFVNTPVDAESAIPPPLEWCHRCIHLISVTRAFKSILGQAY